MLAPKMNTVDAISAFAATSRRSATLCSASLHSPPTVSSGCSAPDFTSTPPDLSVSGQKIRRFRISARGSWVKLRFQNTPPALKQHVADPCRLHHVRLHPASRLVDAPRDLLLRLHDFRMVQLAGITQALREVIRPDAIKIDTRHRENGVQVLQHGRVFQQGAN